MNGVSVQKAVDSLAEKIKEIIDVGNENVKIIDSMGDRIEKLEKEVEELKLIKKWK